MTDTEHPSQLYFEFIPDREHSYAEVHGQIKNIIYDNPYTGWKVVELLSDSNESVLKLAGYLPNIQANDRIMARCSITMHPIFGECLQIDEYDKELPFHREGVIKFMISMVDGIGEHLAEHIVEKFKDKTLQILEEEPEKLTQIDGISEKMVEKIRLCTENIDTSVKELILMGFSPKWSGRIYLKYGKTAPEKIKSNPYRLIRDFKGIGFKKAETIAMKVGIDELDEERLRAAIYFSMLINAVILYTGWRCYKKKDPWSKIAVFGILWFYITLAPTSSFFPTTSYMDDKRVYLSGFGLYMIIVLVYYYIICRGRECSGKSGRIMVSVMLVHVFLLGAHTVNRNRLYQSPFLIWEDVLKKYPNNFKAYNNIGNAWADKNEFAKAIENFNTAVKLNPDDAVVFNNLGKALAGLGDYERAIAAFEKSIELEPMYSIAHGNLANNIWTYNKDFEKAAQGYRTAIEANPYFTDAYLNFGLLYYQNKYYDEARKLFQKAIEIEPHMVQAYFNLGLLYHETKRYKEAKQLYAKAIEIDPLFYKTYNNLGNLYMELKDYKKAEDYYRRALDIKPDYVLVRNSLNHLLKNPGKKVQDLRNPAVLYESEKEKEHFNKAMLYYSRKEYNGAIAEYEQLLKLNPENSDVYCNMGVIYQKLKQVDKAIESYSKAIKLDENSAMPHNNLGVLYQELKEFDKAVNEFKKALKIKPDYIKARRRLANLYYYREDYLSAAAEYEKLLNINPFDEELKWKLEDSRKNIQ